MCSVYCVGLYLDPFLHASDHHGVLDCVGLYIHPLLLAGDLHGVLEGFLATLVAQHLTPVSE